MLQSVAQSPVGLSFKDEHAELDGRAQKQHKHIDTYTELHRHTYTAGVQYLTESYKNCSTSLSFVFQHNLVI